jgi:hypothetical protein
MWKFLRSDQPESSMRLNLFLVTMACVILLLSISFYIVALTFAIVKGASLPNANLAALAGLIQWSPIVAILAGIAALLSSLYYRKVQQTRDENSLILPQTNNKMADVQPDNPNSPFPR